MLADLLSYSLADFMPMEPEVYLRLLERVNTSVWPLQLLTLSVGTSIIIKGTSKNCLFPRLRCQLRAQVLMYYLYTAAFRTVLPSTREKILAFRGALKLIRNQYRQVWLWLTAAWILVGYQFHYRFFLELNWAANYFAYAFVLQGLLLSLLFFIEKTKPKLSPSQLEQWLGIAMMIISVIAYPLFALFSPRPWQSAEVFAIAPDPTCLFTLGALLSTGSYRWWVMLLPILWCFIGGAIAYPMGLFSAWILWLCGGICLLLLLNSYKKVRVLQQ